MAGSLRCVGKNQRSIDSVEYMNNQEKIEAIRKRITLFGGTTISLEKANTIIGFGRPRRRDSYYMLRDITADGKIVGRNEENQTISIPIHWISETHLGYVLQSYLQACKEQLTDSAYKEIEKIIK